MEPLPSIEAIVLSRLHALERSPVERVAHQYPRARVLTAHSDAMRGVIERAESMLVEPCDEFDVDGIYILSMGPEITVVRRMRLLCSGDVVFETTNGGTAETMSLADVRSKVDIVGRVVASCAIRRH